MQRSGVLLLLCAVVGYNATEIFVPRFTADAFHTGGSSQHPVTTEVKTSESKEVEFASSEFDITGWQASPFWRIYKDLFGSHWYKGKNVCSNVSTVTFESNITYPPLARFTRARQCVERGDIYICKTTTRNGTHETRTVEEFRCCPGYHLDYDRRKCTATVIENLGELLRENNATNFEKAMERRNLANQMVFVFPNDDSPVDDETLKTHISNQLIHIGGVILGEALRTPANTTILVKGWPTSSGDIQYSANCKRLLSVNHHISNNTAVHVAKERIPKASQTILEILASDPNLSEATKIAHSVLNLSRDIEEEHMNNGFVYTVFVPTNRALEKFFEGWPEARGDNKVMHSIALLHIYENLIMCVPSEEEESEIKKVDRNGATTLEFKGARIANAEIVARNGIIHVLDEMIHLPLEYQPLEVLLESLGMEQFSKAYKKLKKQWGQKKGTVSAILPVGDHDENPYSDKEIRRHIFRSDDESNDWSTLEELNVYVHIQGLSWFTDHKVTLNCVPLVPSIAKFREGFAVKAARRIPDGYPDIQSALQRTGEHNLFLKLMRKYVEDGGNYTNSTILAIDDAALLKHSESLPKGVRTVLGMETHPGPEDVKELKEFMGNLTVYNEICMDYLNEQDSLSVISGILYPVKKDRDGTWIGGAKVAASDMVAADGIVHSLAGLPKGDSLIRTSIWGLISGFGQSLYDIMFA